MVSSISGSSASRSRKRKRSERRPISVDAEKEVRQQSGQGRGLVGEMALKRAFGYFQEQAHGARAASGLDLRNGPIFYQNFLLGFGQKKMK
jgi:hypothetical protein